MSVSVLSESLSEVAAAELVQRLEVLESRVAGLPPAAAARALRIVDRVEQADKVAVQLQPCRRRAGHQLQDPMARNRPGRAAPDRGG